MTSNADTNRRSRLKSSERPFFFFVFNKIIIIIIYTDVIILQMMRANGKDIIQAVPEI